MEYKIWMRLILSSIKFHHGMNWKGLCLMLSDCRVKWISLLECFCKSFIFLLPLLLKQKILKRDFWGVFSILYFQSLRTMIQVFFKSWVGNETWEVSNYGKFICNIFCWDTVKIGVIRVRVELSVWI